MVFFMCWHLEKYILGIWCSFLTFFYVNVFLKVMELHRDVVSHNESKGVMNQDEGNVDLNLS